MNQVNPTLTEKNYQECPKCGEEFENE